MYQLRHFDMGRDRITVSLSNSNDKNEKCRRIQITKTKSGGVMIDSSESKEDEICFLSTKLLE